MVSNRSDLGIHMLGYVDYTKVLISRYDMIIINIASGWMVGWLDKGVGPPFTDR
jgi:hypothetical protein